MREPGIHQLEHPEIFASWRKKLPKLQAGSRSTLRLKPLLKPCSNPIHFWGQFLGSNLPDPRVQSGPDLRPYLTPYPIHFEGSPEGWIQRSPAGGGAQAARGSRLAPSRLRRHAELAGIAVCTWGAIRCTAPRWGATLAGTQYHITLYARSAPPTHTPSPSPKTKRSPSISPTGGGHHCLVNA